MEQVSYPREVFVNASCVKDVMASVITRPYCTEINRSFNEIRHYRPLCENAMKRSEKAE